MRKIAMLEETLEFIKKLEMTLDTAIGKLDDADENNALDVCKEVSKILDDPYQDL